MARVKQVARFRVNTEGAVERIPQRPFAPACDRNKPPEPTIAKAKARKGGKDKKPKKSRKEDETETESSSSDADEV